jgi:hypothetical protein
MNSAPSVEATRVPNLAAAARTLAAALAIGAGLVACLGSSATSAQDNALEKFLGRWDVRVKTLKPQKPDLTYSETYEWVLDRQFIRAITEGKSDGTQDMVIGGYDPQSHGYPFWIYSSSGSCLSLAPGTWNAQSQIMEWKSPALLDVSYHSRCSFPDANTRRCTLILKNWFGKVLLEQETTAVRSSH